MTRVALVCHIASMSAAIAIDWLFLAALTRLLPPNELPREPLERARAADSPIGPSTIDQLAKPLDLSYDQLGQMLGVSGETVRRWQVGKIAVPAERRAQLAAFVAALGRLTALIKPERLAEAVRRPAGLFDGDRALDWILRGKLPEVVDRYELALLYQA